MFVIFDMNTFVPNPTSANREGKGLGRGGGTGQPKVTLAAKNSRTSSFPLSSQALAHPSWL